MRGQRVHPDEQCLSEGERMSREIRVSASRLKDLWKCSLQSYYKEILNLPDPGHYKARQGTAVHSVMQCMLKLKRATLFRAILRDGFTLAANPAITRFIRAHDRRFGISPYEMEAMEGMLVVAFLALKPYFDPYFAAIDAGQPHPFTYHMEHRFKMTVGKATLSGFIDLLMLYPEQAVVIDYKSQAEKFTRAELPHNPQAIVYQLAVYREFKVLPRVEFILLRHAPSKRYPKLHLQQVDPPPAAALLGLEDYVDATYAMFNSFSLEDAYKSPCKDRGFCERVCKFYKPFAYWALVPEGDQGAVAVRSYVLGAKPDKVDKGMVLVHRTHDGCALKWNGA